MWSSSRIFVLLVKHPKPKTLNPKRGCLLPQAKTTKQIPAGSNSAFGFGWASRGFGRRVDVLVQELTKSRSFTLVYIYIYICIYIYIHIPFSFSYLCCFFIYVEYLFVCLVTGLFNN